MWWKPKDSFSFLIAGLGNPGKKYENTLHNAGYRVITKLAEKLEVKKMRKRASYLYAEAGYGEKKIVLIKPLTYMNLSGKAISDSLRWYRLDSSKLLVVYDDMDLPPGVIRLKARGGSGGHRGLKSVIDTLGTHEFSRLRLGIGKPPEGRDTVAYVLQEYSNDNNTGSLAKAEDLAVEALIFMIDEGIEKAMNKFNVLP